MALQTEKYPYILIINTCNYNYIYVTIGYLLHLRTDWRVMDGVTRPMYFWHGLKGLKFKSLDELYRYYSKEKPITYTEKGKYLWG